MFSYEEESTSEQTTFKRKKPIQARRLLENVVSTQKHHVCLHEAYKSATYWEPDKQETFPFCLDNFSLYFLAA